MYHVFRLAVHGQLVDVVMDEPAFHKDDCCYAGRFDALADSLTSFWTRQTKYEPGSLYWTATVTVMHRFAGDNADIKAILRDTGPSKQATNF